MQSIRQLGMKVMRYCFSSAIAPCALRSVGFAIAFMSSIAVANAAFLAPQEITSTAQYTSTNVTNTASNTVIVTPVPRTPAVITFMHLNANTNAYTNADLYHAGQMIYINVADGDQNVDPYTIQTVVVTLGDSVTGDTETVTLTETGLNTGIFIGSVASSLVNVVPNNNVLSVNVGSKISAVYTDKFDNTDTTAAAALVDPFGVVFDAATGVPVDGATVRIINVATGLPAAVFGDDGVSVYPSTVTTGGTVTDASGAVYNFGPGQYRFPLMNLGDYRLEVTPPTGYSFPSQATNASIQALPTAPYALIIGSRGEQFAIQAGPPLNIDIPLDGKGVNLFVQKRATASNVSYGSSVGYQISVENVHPTTPSTATIVTDLLPLGFRYQIGSATLDGAALADPIIAADARTLTFVIGTLPAVSKAELTYVSVVGSNAKLGPAVNTAQASGVMAAVNVASNVTKATVNVAEELIRSIGFIEGVVFVDEDFDEMFDKSEKGVAGVRIFMEDGRSVVTDKNGRYHFNVTELGTHVLQMDKATIHRRYKAEGLTHTRFANNHYSQFVEVNAGGLARANFRLLERDPEKAPVKVKHTLQEKDHAVWADVTISHGDEVKLFELTGFYMLPKDWVYVEGTAQVDGKQVEPEVTPVGLSWKLSPSKGEQHIRLAMRSKGDSGLKQAVAYARFVSPGSDKGRTGLAKINVQDTLKEIRDQRSFTLDVKFASRKAELPESELVKLDELMKSLDGLLIHELIVEGHTDNIPIAPRNRVEFASNMQLSQARADYIAHYFQNALMIDGALVQAIGKGDLEPVASNGTAKGRKLNRRVVLKIRADKVTYDFSSALQGDLADADGEALGDWGYVEVAEPVKEKAVEQGIISPLDGSSLPNAVRSVRIILPSNLKPELFLDGKAITAERIGFESANKETGKTTYTYIGVDFGKPGSHALQLKGLDTFGNARFEQTVSVARTGEIANIKLVETGDNIADGKTPVRFRLKITDARGVVIAGSLTLQQLGGDLLSVMRSETALLTNEIAQGIRVNADGWVEMAPVTRTGTHHITLGYNKLREKVEVYVKPEMRDWVLVGFAEGTLGYNKLSGAAQPINQPEEGDKFYKDGRVAFYAKGQVSGDFLLTLAYDTQEKKADKNSKFGDVDPNVMYTIYGDTTQQQFEASSSKKLYVKIERDTFYALFGDYNTGLSTTELARYSRSFTGIKAELHEDTLGFVAFATQTSQTMIRDDIRGNGTSGLYRLTRKNILTNSENIRIETVDRFKSEVILDSVQLVRHLDYDIDYVLGTIWFKQPVLSKDNNLNPIIIRIEYESNDLTDEFTTAGGRVYIKPNDNIELGGTFVSEGKLGESNTLNGVDARIQVTDELEVRAEAASSVNNKVFAAAWKVEALLTQDKLTGKAYARSQDNNFGLGQQLGSENSTLKIGADGQYRLDDTSSVNAEMFRQETVNTGATRDMASVQYNKQLEAFNMRAGIRVNSDEDGAGTKTGSTLASLGASKQLTSRLSVRADHEESLSDNNGVDFPSRTSLGADYKLTSTTSLNATQEWTNGKTQNTSSTRVGINTTPWNGSQMSVSYEEQLGENGKRSFANAGLLQTWKISEALSFSASIDQTKVLSKANTVQLNLNAPTATGGEDFTAYSIGLDYKPGTWVWTNRLEYRTSDLSNHQGASLGVQGDLFENLVAQLTMQWQKDTLKLTSGLNFRSDVSLRAAWRPSYDQLVLLNRFDVRRSEQNTATVASNTRSLRYINNLTANWQTTESWSLRFNHGIKLTEDSIGAGSTSSGITDLVGAYLTYDFNADWDFIMKASALRVRSLNNYQPNLGLEVGYNMFDNFWLSMGYNFVGYYDQDFTAAEYAREGMYMRFRFKYDQETLKEWLK